MSAESSPNDPEAIERRHTIAGWAALAVFLALGAVLETLHAFKVGAYLDPEHDTRRLLLRLGHAHGALLALVQLLYAGTVARHPRAARPIASAAHLAALLLLPAGFALGALGAQGGDPSLAIALVPAGAVALAIAVVATAVAVAGERRH